MVVKVIKVLYYMFLRMVAFTARRVFMPSSLGRVLEQDYRSWAKYVIGVFDAELEVEGRGNLPAADGRRVVIVSNHQSQLDIPVLVATLDRTIGFVAKKELDAIPLLSYWMRQVGCVFINRSDKTGAHRALEKAAQAMGGHPLVVFPEGTRSKDGNLLPLKLGGFKLAQLAGARVLPVLIEGSRNAAENRAKGGPFPVPVKVRVFPSLDAQELGTGKAALIKIKDYVETCWRQTSGQPGRELPAGADVR